MGKELAPETSKNLHILTRLSSLETFIKFCLRESLKDYVFNLVCDINLLEPSGFSRNFRLNIHKFYVVLTLLWVFFTDPRTESDFCFIYH
jgi:hypothetical protein